MVVSGGPVDPRPDRPTVDEDHAQAVAVAVEHAVVDVAIEVARAAVERIAHRPRVPLRQQRDRAAERLRGLVVTEIPGSEQQAAANIDRLVLRDRVRRLAPVQPRPPRKVRDPCRAERPQVLAGEPGAGRRGIGHTRLGVAGEPGLTREVA